MHDHIQTQRLTRSAHLCTYMLYFIFVNISIECSRSCISASKVFLCAPKISSEIMRRGN